jgi:sulfur relay (sulfurtransferase) DsrF/TusC family protein
VDFNPKAFINLAPMSSNNFVELQDILHSKKLLSTYAEEALLLNKPSLDQLKKFIKNIIIEALN